MEKAKAEVLSDLLYMNVLHAENTTFSKVNKNKTPLQDRELSARGSFLI